MGRNFQSGTAVLEWANSLCFHTFILLLLQWSEIFTTGHVIPQYVVFVKKYETFFNMGVSEDQFDTLCNDLFENSHVL